MTYVISDLHGYPIEKLKILLEKANFGEDDFLYILGDVIDRNGDGGVGILRWLLSQSNVQLILGNHEAMFLSCEFLFDEITDESVANFDSEKIELLSNYQLNGGDVTLKSLAKLNKESPETVADILDYLHEAPLYEAVAAGGKDYFLCHSGIDNFEKGFTKAPSFTGDGLKEGYVNTSKISVGLISPDTDTVNDITKLLSIKEQGIDYADSPTIDFGTY